MHQHLRIVFNAIKLNVIFAKKFLVSSSTFSKAQTCSKLFSAHRLSFYLVISEKCNLPYAAWFYHYRLSSKIKNANTSKFADAQLDVCSFEFCLPVNLTFTDLFYRFSTTRTLRWNCAINDLRINVQRFLSVGTENENHEELRTTV